MEIDRKFRSDFEKSHASNTQECQCEPQRSKNFNCPPQKRYNDFEDDDRSRSHYNNRESPKRYNDFDDNSQRNRPARNRGPNF
mmetsp:Transcript_24140/g.37084  ORF Transcript_24140/g.37084 Transcript_24140/m.37084 type:complete len:83 (-) Transcript_24140:1061-1309(-)